ncbi:hypothetical protein SAMN05216184_10928 [Georgenia satyanarayanai]|uniref:Uncharacterized protein n=1 Tax=Georgenia satyanarayanai TaxID=860221 RepID=A0A2Y9AKY8_9MICO|nr:hypothetical protein [Georgenia satyanarayanai]PYF99006.1 hypothetical protein A8987_10928 [Georgenia satyanarayanai]SSA43968.1 hypothetical protein SAMN05216184_10928 [Georgenia satyanarayanai]
MDPHLLHDLAARSSGLTMADFALVQRLSPSRPRKPRTTIGWPGRRRR